jgi:EAL and modified HD-GYP domain-containing signal transduction protein
MVDVFLARQPIYYADRRIHGFELLFRGSATGDANVRDGNAATARLLLNAVVDIGLEKICGQELLFVNCTREFLMMEPFIPPNRCVLEILEDVDLDRELLERIAELRRQGYRIALDDFTLNGNLSAAVPLADYIKLDVLALSEAELRRHTWLRRPGLLLVAEKVDSESHMEHCRDLGFDLFQGYFLRRPETLKGGRIPTGKLAALRLIGACQDADASIQEIAAIISLDVSMTYSLLRLANSAMFGRSRPVRSVEAVVTSMGTEYLARWATLLALAADRGCPATYLEAALQRAFMCESLEMTSGDEAGGAGFFVGLLSMLDSLLNMPMKQILENVRLASDVRDALTRHGGKLGHLLAYTLAYESGDAKTLDRCRIDGRLLREAYWRSIAQARTALRELYLQQVA